MNNSLFTSKRELNKLKVKVFLIETLEALRMMGGYGTHLFKQSAYKASEVVSPMRQMPSPPGMLLVLISDRG